jgi:hypothetical protein
MEWWTKLRLEALRGEMKKGEVYHPQLNNTIIVMKFIGIQRLLSYSKTATARFDFLLPNVY